MGVQAGLLNLYLLKTTVEPLLSSHTGEWPFLLLKGGGSSAQALTQF